MQDVTWHIHKLTCDCVYVSTDTTLSAVCEGTWSKSANITWAWQHACALSTGPSPPQTVMLFEPLSRHQCTHPPPAQSLLIPTYPYSSPPTNWTFTLFPLPFSIVVKSFRSTQNKTVTIESHPNITMSDKGFTYKSCGYNNDVCTDSPRVPTVLGLIYS